MTKTISTERVCSICNKLLKVTKRSNALYCGKRCKNKAFTIRKHQKIEVMSQEFCIDRFAHQIKTSLEFYRWSLNKLMIQYESRELSLMDYSDAHQEIIRKADLMHEKEITEALIDGAINNQTIEVRILHYYKVTFNK